MNPRIQLTVGPVLYYWPRKTLIDFYGVPLLKNH